MMEALAQNSPGYEELGRKVKGPRFHTYLIYPLGNILHSGKDLSFIVALSPLKLLLLSSSSSDIINT